MAKRCLTACLALAIGCSVLGAGIAAGRLHDAADEDAAARAAGVGAGISPRALARSILAGDAETALDGLGAGAGEVAALPAAFQDEFFSLAGYDRVMVDGAGLVGFSRRGGAEDTFALLRREMEEKGWTCTPLGVGCAGTFTKESGVFRWAFLSCYPVGTEVSAVLQYR